MVARLIVQNLASRTRRLWRTALGKILLLINVICLTILASAMTQSGARADGPIGLLAIGTFITGLGLWAAPRGTGRWRSDHFRNERADAAVLLGIGLCLLALAGLAAALIE